MKKSIKKALSLVLAITLLLGCVPLSGLSGIGFKAAAADYTDGDFTFTLSNSQATITKYTGSTETVEVPDTVSDGEFEYSVTAIGSRAFADCQSSKVVLPEGVTTLGGLVFENSTVTEVEIIGRIENASKSINKYNIDGSGFLSKSNVEKVTMHKTNIPSYMFAGAEKLKDISIPKVAIYSNDAIGSYAFYNCASLKEFTIPYGIKDLGAGELGIGSSVFAGTSLTEIDIPNTVEKIGYDAFANCAELKKITLPESVYSLGSSIFKDSAVTEVTIKGRITDANYTNGITGNTPFCGSRVTTVTMEKSHIAPGLFFGCSTLATINLPATATDDEDIISVSAFKDCINLKEILIPAGIKAINSEAFYGCEKLESIVIPSSVTTIGEKAFYDCFALGYIHFDNIDCTYSDITNINNIKFCTSVAEKPLGFVECTHTVNIDTPVTPPDEPAIPDELEAVEKTSSNGIKVEYDSSYFENNDEIVLKAEEKDKFSSNIAEYDKDGVIIKRYDIHLEDKNGNVVKHTDDSTEYTVRIPVPSGYEDYTQFMIRHWLTLANGNKKSEILNGKVENGYIVFKTKSFSDFEVLVEFGFQQDSLELIYTESASDPATTYDGLTITYTSSNTDIVTVDENGNIVAKGRGTATITATFTNGYGETFTDTCEITVKFTFWQWLIYILLFGFLWY